VKIPLVDDPEAVGKSDGVRHVDGTEAKRQKRDCICTVGRALPSFSAISAVVQPAARSLRTWSSASVSSEPSSFPFLYGIEPFPF